MHIIEKSTEVSLEALSTVNIVSTSGMTLPEDQVGQSNSSDVGSASEAEAWKQLELATNPSSSAVAAITPVSTISDVDLMSALFGGTSESCLDLATSTKPFAVCLYKDGLWEKRENKIGTFIFQREKFIAPYITKDCKTSFTLKLPKIPGSVLNETVRIFKEIMKTMGNSESMVQIYWDEEKSSYEVHVPEQYVAGASIKFIHDKELQNNDKKIWVLDIHSHNTMNAFFSGGDDRDEKSTRLFGVLGQLNQNLFAHKWRAGCNGKYLDLSIIDIFNLDDEAQSFRVSDEDLKKIKPVSEMPKELRDTVQSVGGPGSQGGNTHGYNGGGSYHGIYQGHGYSPSENRQWNKHGNQDNWMPGQRTPSRVPVKYTGWQGGMLNDIGGGSRTQGSRKWAKNVNQNHSGSGRFPGSDWGSINDPDDYPGFGFGGGGAYMDEYGPANSIESGVQNDNYHIKLKMSGEIVKYDAYKGFKQALSDMQDKLKDGPTVMFKNSKDQEFTCASQILFELLESVLEQIAKELPADISSNTVYMDDLGDISVLFGSILSHFVDKDKYVSQLCGEAYHEENKVASTSINIVKGAE
jgi:PRTRC genetic system protein A